MSEDVTGWCRQRRHKRCDGTLRQQTGWHWYCACKCHPEPEQYNRAGRRPGLRDTNKPALEVLRKARSA